MGLSRRVVGMKSEIAYAYHFAMIPNTGLAVAKLARISFHDRRG
jgi:hypothetical protein